MHNYLAEPCGASFRVLAGSRVVLESMIPRADSRCGRMANSLKAQRPLLTSYIGAECHRCME